VEHRSSLDDDAADSGWQDACRKFDDFTRSALHDASRVRFVSVVENLESIARAGELIDCTALRTGP
jgi:hypothetical protein